MIKIDRITYICSEKTLNKLNILFKYGNRYENMYMFEKGHEIN